MNFRNFGNQFKSSYRHYQGFSNQGSNFARQFATMNNMTLRMAQRTAYQYQMGAYLASRGIQGTPSLISVMMQSQQASNVLLLTQGSDDLLTLLRNELLLDSEDDTL